MYKLHLDLHLYFVPPMTEDGAGIIVTREIELPFPAFEGLRVFSKEFDDCPEPLGFTLKDVVWDVDRKLFLADSSLISSGLPIACIPDSIRDWIHHGWRLGSLRDAYIEPDEQDEVDADPPGQPRTASPEEEERMHTLPPRRRTKEFNRLFNAMVRHMAEEFVDIESAYAMECTGSFFSETEISERMGEPAVKKWAEARAAFSRMSTQDRLAWRERATRYASIEEIVLEADGRPRSD
ncbi:MAG: hypothetical protein KF691_04115 [Phycisphaeraceae bacterium]|nr:hypothetical protein [Phycisphaeraceae bacterium]